MAVLAESRLAPALPAMLIALAFFGLFHDKAFTIDDPYFLLQAQYALTDPLHPSSFDIAWNNNFGRASELSPSGPMMAYLLIPTVLAGGAEWVAHLTVTAFLCWSAYSLARLASLLGFSRYEATAASMILVATPTVIAMGSTSMPDVPGLAFGLAGVERWAAFLVHKKWTQAVGAVAFLTLTVLTRSHAAGLLGICLLSLWLPVFGKVTTIRSRSLRLIPLAAVPAAVLIVSTVTGDAQGETNNLVSTVGFLEREHARSNFLAFCGHYVFALPLAPAWLAMRGRQVLRRPLLLAVLITTLLCWTAYMPWWMYIMTGLGAAALLDILVDAWRRGDALQMILGLWLLMPLPICFYIHLPSKYLVLSAPAMALLLVRESRHCSRTIRRAGWGLWLAGALGLGFLIIHADARRADVGRRAAREWIEKAPHHATVWYGGHWGFQWYAEQAGAKSLLIPSAQPQAGDSIVCGHTWMAQTAKYYCRVLSTLTEARPGGRVMSNGAGFYSNTWGDLPVSWGSDEAERYTLLVVTDSSTRW